MFRVKGMGQGYDVRVQENSLDLIGEMLKLRGLRGPIAVVCDVHTGAIFGEGVRDSLERAGYAQHAIIIPAGEAHKNTRTVAAVWEGFLKAGIERSSTVIALGGGVVSDLAGFAAATFLRGVPWAAAPTSLLAMVDASLGGKTGVDLPQGKNLVGAFYPPQLVLADSQALHSLPEAEFRSGLAEVVKAGVIDDPQLFSICSQGWEAVQRKLDDVVRRAVAVKIAVIEDDPYEKGRRASLNFGHTIGHAVELASSFELRHGEAVAIGMVAEARLAERLGIAQAGLADEIERVLKELGLPVEIPQALARPAILAAMQVDKKRHAGSLRFALPARIGEVKFGVDVKEEDIDL
jgi:3-dehydroquinate synthase